MHEIESNFFIGEVPWHGLGRKLDNPFISAKEAMMAAGLDWSVSKRQVFFPDGDKMVLVPDKRALVRDSDSHPLSIMSDGYKPLQNAEAFSFFDSFIGEGKIGYETAGSLQGGRKIWILARLQREALEITEGDAIIPHLLLANSHDGSLNITVGFCPTRVVCMNTLRIALSESGSKLIRIWHRTNAIKTLNEVKEVINLANQSFEASAEQYRRLASRPINKEDLNKYINQIFPITGEDKGQDFSRNGAKVFDLFQHSRFTAKPGETYWDAYNAVTEFLSHEAGRSNDGRLQSLWFGVNGNTNQNALNTALRMAA